MQQSGVDNSFPLSDVVATFPQGKAIVKRLIKETESYLEEVKNEQDEARGRLSSKISMLDIDLAMKLIDTVRYGTKIEEAQDNLSRLKRLMYMYEPPKHSHEGVSEMDIQTAKYVRIKSLVKVRGNEMKALCPFHDDHKPSMKIYPDNHAYCFVCNRAADSIDIAMHQNTMDFVTAVKWLNKMI